MDVSGIVSTHTNLSLFMSSAACAEQTSEAIVSGADEYTWNCSTCHSQAGKGNGPLAALLFKNPSDLTHISRDNGGIFPSQHMFEVNVGRKDIPGHQTFQILGSWDRFRQTEGQRDYNSAETRIREVANYLESLQATE